MVFRVGAISEKIAYDGNAWAIGGLPAILNSERVDAVSAIARIIKIIKCSLGAAFSAIRF